MGFYADASIGKHQPAATPKLTQSGLRLTLCKRKEASFIDTHIPSKDDRLQTEW